VTTKLPIYGVWRADGTFAPLPRFEHRAAEQLVVGHTYRIVEGDEPSTATKNHLFLCIGEAFKNLPEHIAGRFVSPEHLRKWCLIKEGYADERNLVFDTPGDAQRAAVLMSQLNNQFAVIVVRECVVSIYVAKSIRPMDKKEFQECKEKVLDRLAAMLGIKASELLAQVPVPAQYRQPSLPRRDHGAAAEDYSPSAAARTQVPAGTHSPPLAGNGAADGAESLNLSTSSAAASEVR
jgi:hypothetical protein